MWGGQPAAGIQQHRALAQHRQQVAQKLRDGGGAQLPRDIDRVGPFQHPHRALQFRLVDPVEKVMQRGNVAHHQIAQDALIRPFLRLVDLVFQRADPRLEHRCRRRQALVKDALQFAKAGVAQHLRESHEARRVHAAAVGDGVDRQHRHVVGILGQEHGDLLRRLCSSRRNGRARHGSASRSRRGRQALMSPQMSSGKSVGCAGKA